MPTIPAGGRVKFKFSNNTLSPYDLVTSLATITFCPNRGPCGIKISRLSSFSLVSSFNILSYALRRAFDFVERAFGAMRTHSNSCSSVFLRLLACFSSCANNFVFCSSHDE